MDFMNQMADSAGEQMGQAQQAVGKAYHQSKELIIVGLLVLLGSLGTGGWNEYRNVATLRTISLAKDHHNKVDCSAIDSKMEGKLIHFSCDVSGQTVLGTTTIGVPAGASGFKLTVHTEVFRPIRKKTKVVCPNSESQEKKCDKITYKKGWETNWEQYTQARDPDRVCDQNTGLDCDATNRDPTTKSFWTSQTMQFGTQEIQDASSSAKIGPWKLPSDLLSKIWQGTTLTPSCGTTPCTAGTSVSGNYLIYRHDGVTRTNDDIGDVRRMFTLYDVKQTKNSVLAEQKGETLIPWLSPYDSDYDIYEAMPGELTPEDMFTALEEINQGTTWFLRLLTLVLTMSGVFCIVSPVSVMADLIPVIGDFVSNVVDFFLGIFSCASGCMCWTLVAGVVWVLYRPYVGIPLLVVTLLSCAGLVYWRMAHPDVGRDDNKTDIANGLPVESPGQGMDFCPSCGAPKPTEVPICNKCDQESLGEGGNYKV